MFLGWKWLPVDEEGYPSEIESDWEGECFVLFGWVVYVGAVRRRV